MNNPLKQRRTRLGAQASASSLTFLLALLITVAAPIAPCLALAQEGSFTAGQELAQKEPATSSNLSDWLLAHPTSDNDYLLGLSWLVPGEVQGQAAQRDALLSKLNDLKASSQINQQMRIQLQNWIAQLPVTGRVPVPVADVRWLQANPNRDPVLQPGHSVVVPKQPATVTVLGVNSHSCQAFHSPSRRLMDYVNACAPGRESAADWVWIVQPDGRIQRFGVANWNLTQQNEPAPGAWIWAPGRNEGWPEEISARLVEFLATQGPASDNVNLQAVEPVADVSTLSYGEPHDIAPTSSDWGGVGLLQTPSARMREAGDMLVNVSRTYPYTHFNVSLQPFDWLEAGYRYTDIGNRLIITGNQTYRDKSLDLKFRLMRESAYLPEVAVGWRDLVGTGLFSSQYLVASKRTGDFDWSVGLGWGYLGSRGDLKNPLSVFSKRMNKRPHVAIGQSGTFSPKSYFRGRTSLFGGVQYQTPWAPLVLKLEYDGSNYRNEPFDNILKQRSAFNIGAVYRATDWVDINIGFERGNTSMLGVTLHAPLAKLYTPKVSDPSSVPVADIRPQYAPVWQATSSEFTRQTDWPVKSIEQKGNNLRVTVEDADAGYWRQRLDRGVSVLHRDVQGDIESFTVAYRNHGMEMAEHQVDRNAWVNQQTKALPPSEQQNPVVTHSPTPADGASPVFSNSHPVFENNVGLGLNYSLGSPDSFALYQLYAKDEAKLHFGESIWLQGSVHLALLDNYNKFKYTQASNLPRVRTLIRDFVTSSKFTMPNLQLTHTGKFGENNFYSLYGGYLEEMYAGVGGEWLYRPFESRLALGVDVNAVRIRDFKQGFALQEYKTVTGHATLYWDIGWNNIQVNLSAGRYLAKDYGMSMEMLRYFDNGVTMGAGFTKTNVSTAQFGEGSFDKWIRITVPFDALLPKSASSDARITWQPLIRDGGAKLHRAVELYDMTRIRDKRTMEYKPAPLPNENVIPENRR